MRMRFLLQMHQLLPCPSALAYSTLAQIARCVVILAFVSTICHWSIFWGLTLTSKIDTQLLV